MATAALSFKNRYGRLDRLLHRVAFATTWAQRGTADIEERLFRKELAAVELGPPVLITGLPRAGTTILLEILAGSSTFASHTYRDMPFVLCPLLWNRLSKPFQRQGAPRERAHGDGIQLSADSPEAFEEVLWQRFWPQHYRGSTIATWPRCDEAEFLEFFRSHMRKIVTLRARDKPTATRYVSKNNLNVARIPAVLDACSDATVLVPFREPVQHAVSLLRQHERFLAMHTEDAFARRYMADIGHFDFGANLKPINFGGWMNGRSIQEAHELGFWLDYWIATYQHVQKNAAHDRLHLICFEALGAALDLKQLADCLGLLEPDSLQAGAKRLRPAKMHEVDQAGLNPSQVAKATDLYEQMRRESIL
jgi:hypothetical protein